MKPYRELSVEELTELKGELKHILFTTKTCQNCPTAKRALDEAGINYVVVDAGEHIGECAGQRGEGNNQTGKNGLEQFCFNGEDPDQQTGGEGDQKNTEDAPYPRHGNIGKSRRNQQQSPSSGADGGTLAEKGFNLVMVYKLVCESVAMGDETRDESAQQGQPVLGQKGAEGREQAL